MLYLRPSDFEFYSKQLTLRQCSDAIAHQIWGSIVTRRETAIRIPCRLWPLRPWSVDLKAADGDSSRSSNPAQGLPSRDYDQPSLSTGVKDFIDFCVGFGHVRRLLREQGCVFGIR